MVDCPHVVSLDQRLDSIANISDPEVIKRWTNITGILRQTLTKEKKRLFGIEGNIGTGKSTLANLLQGEIGVKAYLEDVDSNPTWKDIIEIFYSDRIKHGFRTQLALLPFRLKQAKDAFEYPGSAIIDRTYWADQFVFVQTLIQEGFPQEKVNSLNEEYEIIHLLFPKINLMFLLTCTPETANRRIIQRARGMETSTDLTNITLDENHYLKKIGSLYEALPQTLYDKKLYQGPWIKINQEKFKIRDRAHTTILLECIADELGIKYS